MLRYLRLYLYFLRFSFSRALEFRVDFYFRVVMDIAFYAVNLAFFAILYLHTDLLGGWDLDQALIFVSGVFVIDAVHMTVFSNNMWWLPIFINRGDLDYYLVRPVSSLYFLSLRDFAANSFLNLLIALGVLLWAILRYPGELEPANVGAYALLLALGSLLNYTLYMFFIIPAFWMHNTTGVVELFYALEKFAERPDQIYRGWVRRLLVSILPLALIISVPTHALFEGLTPIRLLHILLVGAAAFLAMLLFWSRGLRAYASASS